MVKYIIAYVLEHAPKMAFFDEFVQPGLLARLNHIVDRTLRTSPPPAIDLLQESGRRSVSVDRWGIDLQSNFPALHYGVFQSRCS